MAGIGIRGGNGGRLGDIEQEIQQSPLGGLFNRRNLAIGLFAIVFVTLLLLSGSIVETNDAGSYTVKQAAISGKMTAYTAPGTFIQGFGNVFKYRQSDALYFSKHDAEGKSGEDPIEARFNDGATASVTGNVRVELPADPEKLLAIHQRFRSYDALMRDTVKQVVSEAVILTAALMTAEESYTTKRAEFSQLAYDQVKNGIYLTEADDYQTKDPKTGEIVIKRLVNIQTDKNGNPLRKESVLSQYGIGVSQFVIKEIDYPESIQNTIRAKQEALMKTVSAKAEAEKAVQDRLTAEEVGKKNVMTARYEQEVENAKTIASAERDLKVAVLDKQKAEQYKLTQILKGEGEAEYRRKIMAADGSLQIKLQAWLEKEKAWANAYATRTQSDVPSVIMGGSGPNGKGGYSAIEQMMGVIAARSAQDMVLPAVDK